MCEIHYVDLLCIDFPFLVVKSLILSCRDIILLYLEHLILRAFGCVVMVFIAMENLMAEREEATVLGS